MVEVYCNRIYFAFQQVNENADKLSDKMASELVTKERKIMSLQQRIERHLANEAAM